MLLFLVVAGIACAQQTGAAAGVPAGTLQGTPRRLLVLVTQTDGAGFSADELFLLSGSLLLGLQMDEEVRAVGAVLLQPGGRSAPGTDPSRTEAAVAAGADAWLWVEVSRAGQGSSLRVRSYDLARQKQAVDQSVAVDNGLAPLELPDADWSGVAGLVAQAYPPLREDSEGMLVEGPTAARLTVRARPGSIVTSGQGPKLRIGDDGSGVLTLSVPAEYTLRATAAGFSPATERVFLTADREVTLTQRSGARWAVEASLDGAAFPGASGAWFFVPDWVSVGLGVATYAFGLALNNDAVFVSAPLTNVFVTLGTYVAPADWAFRPYVDVSAFLRIIHAKEYFGLEPLSPIGLRIALGTEMGRTLGGGFFLEYAASMHYTSVPNLFRASLGAWDIPPGWLFTPSFAFNILGVRLGYRWLL